MRRREFIKAVAAAVIAGGSVPEAFAKILEFPSYTTPDSDQAFQLEDYLEKMRHFNEPHPGDVYVDAEQHELLNACVRRLERLQTTAGHGKLSLLDFDDGLTIASDYSVVGAFPKRELDFLEMIFYRDAAIYGFYGKKSLKNITDRIPTRDVVKIPRSGNFLYKGPPLEAYEKLRRDVGDQAVLTSGVRGVMKQFLLFLRKAVDYDGNFSLASRSLAPPGFSFHGISDFDVGQVGFGPDNFTERFVTSQVFQTLKDLDYVDLRYPLDNMLGVRFEPWHIKVA